MAQEKIVIASDHAGVSMKAAISDCLVEMGCAVLDLGTDSTDAVDYPDYSEAVANALGAGKAERGVIICGTGIGISIAANRHRHVRAALCHSETDARSARAHNNANVLALGARTMGIQLALDCLRVFLQTPFEGGRHQRRVEKFS
jgi:ribose 5-phosphate isomerase B